MVSYKVVHHISGRIRIEVPSIKRLSVNKLKGLFIVLSSLPVPIGIKGIRVNPLTYSLVIEYDPRLVDVIEYVKDMASSRTIMNTIAK